MLEQIGSNEQTLALTDWKQVQRILIGEKPLTDAAISLLTVSMPAGAMFNAFLIWGIAATDGTDMQAFSGISSISAVNKAGAYTSSVVELAGIQSKSVSAGTLTEAVTITTQTNQITIVMTPAGSLTEPAGSYRVLYTLINLSRHAVALT